MEGTGVTTNHRDDRQGTAWFEIKGEAIYTTEHHPKGRGQWPWFEIRDSQVFTTDNHPQGRVGLPWYEIHGNRMYTARTHPDGYAGFPLFEIRDGMIYGITHTSPMFSPTNSSAAASDRGPAIAEMKKLDPPDAANGSDAG